MMFDFDLTKTIENMKKNIRVVDDAGKYDRAIVTHPFYKEMRQEIVAIINEKTIKSKIMPRILEIGFGTGTLTESLLKCDFKELVSIEPEDIDYEFTKNKFSNVKNSNFFLMKQDFWEIKDKEKFDVIVTSFVDHHIPMNDKKSYYQKILNLLSPNGIFIAGEEPIGDYTSEDERIIQLFRYHGYIIKTCIENSDFDMAEIETRALKNGIEKWDEYKIGVNMYKKVLEDADMKIHKFLKLGPSELKEGGIYVVVTGKN